MISRRKESTRRESENPVNIGRAFACPLRILDVLWDFFPICSFLDISLSYLEFHPLYLYIAAKCSLAIKRHALKFVE